MKTTLLLYTFLLTAFFTTLNAQDFITTIYFEDALGNMDAVNIGYDVNASYAIDPQFNEVDISTQPFDDVFEVRAAAYNYDLVECDYWEESSWNMESKTFINYYDCATGMGLFQEANSIALMIKAKHLPVTVSWDNTLFTESCRDNSLLVNWMPGGWFDACCCFDSGEFNQLSQQSNYVFNNTDVRTIKGSDTLFALFIPFGDEVTLSDQIVEAKHSIDVFPNPTTGQINIEGVDLLDVEIQIFDFSGRRIPFEKKKTINTSNWSDGIYYLQILDEKAVIATHKIIKYGL